MYMSLGVLATIGIELYLKNMDSVNHNMEKIMKNPEKALCWIKKHM